MELFKNRICLSQAGSNQGGGGPVGPSIQTLTGNAGGPVSPAANNVNIVSDSTAYTTNLEPSGYLFRGNIQANTLTFLSVPYTTQTIGAVSNAIFTLNLSTIAASCAVTISAELVTATSDFSFSGTGYLIGGAVLKAGVVTLLTIDTVIADDDPTGDLGLTFTTAGTSVIIGVSGIAARTYNWTAFVRYLIQQ